MINLTPDQIVIEVDKEMKTGKHKYLWLAKEEVAKRFNINSMTLDNYYYQAKEKKRFNVWIKQVNASLFEIKALNRDEAISLAQRLWRNQNKHPDIEEVQECKIDKQEVKDG